MEKGINVLSLFDGISCGKVALDNLGIKINKYYSSEIDPYAIRISQNNHKDIIMLGDVTQVSGKDLENIDLLIGGSPCQGFSFAGKGLNFEDERSKLFFEFVRLLKETKPKYFLLENVKMKKEHQDIISEYLGVKPTNINSKLVSAQSRERLFWTNIPLNMIKPKNILLKYLVEGEVEDKYYISETKEEFIKRHNIKLQFPRDKAFTIPAQFWKQGKQECRNLIKDDKGWRRFTPLEMERIFGLKDNYTQGESDTRRYFVMGNSWSIKVIEHIFEGLPYK